MKRTDLIYQWRKDNPNFTGALPTPKFPFLILLRSRKQNNFGIISTGIMPKKKEEKAFLFNSSSKIVFSKLKSCEGLPAATFSSNIWVFGNSEVIIKK